MSWGRGFLVQDSNTCPGGNGLSLNSDRDVVCYRHNSIQHGAKGIWEVEHRPSGALLEIDPAARVRMCPAVIDDFGNLVIVGVLQ